MEGYDVSMGQEETYVFGNTHPTYNVTQDEEIVLSYVLKLAVSPLWVHLSASFGITLSGRFFGALQSFLGLEID